MEGFNLTIILVLFLILFSSMDFKHKIIQWNCRGLKPNYNEVSLLISEYNPSVFCFQETFLKPDVNISLRGFIICNYVHTDCLRPSGGASIFVKSSFPQRKIDLQTELQATAVSVTLDREITICSVYIPPSFSLNSQHLDNLLQQLPSPYILLGDFNGHNILWGGQNNDSRGELIENSITKNDICIMNDNSYTYHSPSTKSFTSIDLSFCHPSLFLDYNWSVCEDQHNSDHFPIIIEQNTFSKEDHNPKWKLNRANWELFNTLCTGKLVPENFKESSDSIADLTSSLMKYLKNVFLKLRQIQLKVSHGTMTTVNKQLNSANKLYLNSKDLQIPTISMTSTYLELKPLEQLNFRSVSHGDLMFRKSIIKHLLKRFGI